MSLVPHPPAPPPGAGSLAPSLLGPRLLLVPSGLPEPEEPRATTAAAVALDEVLEGVPGLTLVVSPRRRLLDTISERVRRRFGGSGSGSWSVPFAGDRTLLLCDPENAVAVLAGRVLTCLVLDRLPLPRGQAGFVRELPDAIDRFCDLAGLLDHARTDPGLFVVLDPRLVSRPYGRWFLAALPPMPRTRRLDDVAAFFAPTPALRRAS